jgi:glucokinase
MDTARIYLGIDCGATTSKVSAIDVRGAVLTDTLRQRPTCSEQGPAAIVKGWVNALCDLLADLALDWSAVASVGLAIPGPYLGYGVLGPMPNMPDSLTGWHFLDDLAASIASVAGDSIPVVTANDGLLAGLAEARRIQADRAGSVLMFAPGSGLGCSFVSADGHLLQGDHGAAAILSHTPAPHALLGLPAFNCGCGRTWGCFETYTAISGLPQLVQHLLPQFPQHPLAQKTTLSKADCLPLRGLAQSGDPLALAVFELQAKALGLAVCVASMAYDPTHIVIGGGLMDPEVTTERFRADYLKTVEKSAAINLWGDPKELSFHIAALGELSQAVGAAFYAQERFEKSL